jgi:hypothetical protein
MPDSERVTWEECPSCRQPAAVGWVNDRPVEFDCPAGCRLSVDQFEGFGTRLGVRPHADWFLP